jgi:hypothetical protein
MATSCHVTGLSFAKGRRLEDISSLNPEFSKEELLKTLTILVEENKILSYQKGKEIFYMLPP